MIGKFSVRLIGHSYFATCRQYTRHSLIFVLSQCSYSRLVNARGFLTRASIHQISISSYVKTTSANESAEHFSVPNAIDDCLDYSQFSHLADDSSIETKIKLIIMEYEVSKQSGGRIPSVITVNDMKELVQLSSPRARTKFFNYLFVKEKAKLAEQRKKEKRKVEHEQKRQERKANQLGPKNTFFIHIRNSSMLKFYNSRQAHSLMFGSPLVFDMGYGEFMANRESINCAYQISMAYGANKVHRDPFNLYLCNAKSDDKTMHYLANSVPHLNAANCLLNITEMSYLDIFPKDRIVYLTPNAEEMLHNFDHDAVYVIGGFIDKSCPKPLSLAKAKRENLKMAKLPLDYYLHWGEGSKALTLNQMIEIMLEAKHSNNWKEAFKFVPTRKLKKIDLEAEKLKLFNKKEKALGRKLRIPSLFEKD